ncbi:MAG: uroporphyrinogen decarboxylase, partial [Micromonosporaceae bacterium]|nr:uroporphyrinogen decarboxylase [Micromonosporaceae bacterium]
MPGTSDPDGPTGKGFLGAAWGVETPTAPIWLMRQAGRYLPEYRALRAGRSFWQMVTTPEIAAEITMQPLLRFPLDAAILFSDIMTPLPAMGVPVEFTPGPRVAEPIRTPADVAALRIPEEAAIAPFVTETIAMVTGATAVPLIGFAGAPLTLAGYLVQGSGGGDFAPFRAWLRAEPGAATDLIDLLATVTIRYLQAQIRAGARAVQLFDTWAGVHDPVTYERFGLPALHRVFQALAGWGVPRIYMAVGCAHLYRQIAQLPIEMLSVDWRTPLPVVRTMVPNVAVQGNLDPAALLAGPEALAA